MSELLHQLGIDWRLLLSQGFNFLIVLLGLSFLVYRPLLRILEERRKKIELGLKVGIEAEKRLGEIAEQKKATIAAADQEAVSIVAKSEAEAKKRANEFVAAGAKQADDIIAEAKVLAVKKRAEEAEKLSAEAAGLLRQAIAKAMEESPEKIDEQLISRASGILREKLKVS